MREIAINRETRATPSGTRDMTDEGCNAIDSNKNAERTGEQSGCLALDGILTVSRVCQFVPSKLAHLLSRRTRLVANTCDPGQAFRGRRSPFGSGAMLSCARCHRGCIASLSLQAVGAAHVTSVMHDWWSIGW